MDEDVIKFGVLGAVVLVIIEAIGQMFGVFVGMSAYNIFIIILSQVLWSLVGLVVLSYILSDVIKSKFSALYIVLIPIWMLTYNTTVYLVSGMSIDISGVLVPLLIEASTIGVLSGAIAYYVVKKM